MGKKRKILSKDMQLANICDFLKIPSFFFSRTIAIVFFFLFRRFIVNTISCIYIHYVFGTFGVPKKNRYSLQRWIHEKMMKVNEEIYFLFPLRILVSLFCCMGALSYCFKFYTLKHLLPFLILIFENNFILS